MALVLEGTLRRAALLDTNHDHKGIGQLNTTYVHSQVEINKSLPINVVFTCSGVLAMIKFILDGIQGFIYDNRHSRK